MGDIQANGKDAFCVSIGRADKGRTFVRVVHILSGKEKFQVGLGSEDAHEVAERLTEELRRELGLTKP